MNGIIYLTLEIHRRKRRGVRVLKESCPCDRIVRDTGVTVCVTHDVLVTSFVINRLVFE